MVDAEELFNDMQRAELSPDARVFSSLIRGHAEDGNLEAAERHMEEMSRYGFQPSQYEYTQLLKACSRARPPKAEAAERVFRQMLAAGLQPSREVLGHLWTVVGQERYAELRAGNLLGDAEAAASPRRARSSPPSTSKKGTWEWKPQRVQPKRSPRPRSVADRRESTGAQ